MQPRARFRSISLPVVLCIALGVPQVLFAQSIANGDPFVGITPDGQPRSALFPIRASGVSTGPIMEAARAYLATLTPDQVSKTRFDLEAGEWGHWSNVPINNLERQGLAFREMNERQREAAFALVRSGLSARGFEQARDIMRIDGYLADFLDNHEGYGEDLYYIDIFGEPSTTEPWGWQLDGHHLVVNYFVMGDQVVMSPNFWGAEPVTIEQGEYAGIQVLQEEQDRGLALMQSLGADQLRIATIESEKTSNSIRSAAFRDNMTLEYEGIRGDQLDAAQKELLLGVVEVYVGAMRDEHARVRMEEVRSQLDETYFAWIGEVGPEALFYYRI
jgi:Protein of unknown function (DUF3500)